MEVGSWRGSYTDAAGAAEARPMMSTLLRPVDIRSTVAPAFTCESLPTIRHAMRWMLQHASHGPALILNIDGVLRPSQSGTLICLPLLETWLRTHPDADVMTSSGWRRAHMLDKLRNFFPIGLRECTIGCTPALPDCTKLGKILYIVRECGVA